MIHGWQSSNDPDPRLTDFHKDGYFLNIKSKPVPPSHFQEFEESLHAEVK